MVQEEVKRVPIWLSNYIINDENLSFEGILAYVALRYIFKKNYEYSAYHVSLGGLKYQLTGIYAYNSRFEKRIKSGILELQKIGVVKILDESKIDMLLDLSGIKMDTSKVNFTIIYLDEVNCILNTDYQGRFSLLKYFTMMIETINHSKKQTEPNDYYASNVGTQTIVYLSKRVSVSERTAINYNKKLEEMKLIYICNSTNAVRNDKGEIINSFSNVYGRPEYKKEIDFFQKQRECKNGNSGLKLSKENTNIRRSMKQRYNHLLKKIKDNTNIDEDISVIQEVYDFFLVQNENYDKKLKECKEKSITPSNLMMERVKVDIEPLKKILDKHYDVV